MDAGFIREQNSMKSWTPQEFPGFQKKWTVKDFKKLTPAKVGNMTTPELAHLVQTMQNRAKNAVSRIKKAGLFSYAVAKLGDYAEESGLSIYKKIYFENKQTGAYYMRDDLAVRAHAKLVNRALRLQGFFTSQTSTIRGIKKTNKLQNIAIFGKNKDTGNPLDTLTDEERELFWEMVDEFRTNPTGKLYDFYSIQDNGIIYEVWGDPNNRPKTLMEAIVRANEIAPSFFMTDVLVTSKDGKSKTYLQLDTALYPYGLLDYKENPEKFGEYDAYGANFGGDTELQEFFGKAVWRVNKRKKSHSYEEKKKGKLLHEDM